MQIDSLENFKKKQPMVSISFQNFKEEWLNLNQIFTPEVIQTSPGKDTVDTLYTQHHQQQGKFGQVVTKSKNPWVRPINKK